jgi:hypothetical protein
MIKDQSYSLSAPRLSLAAKLAAPLLETCLEEAILQVLP